MEPLSSTACNPAPRKHITPTPRPTSSPELGVPVTLPTPYQAVAPELDLQQALRSAKSNDLLPPRLEDKTLGELGSRFVEDLRRRLDRGTYDPQPSYSVAVPKSTVGTRPAALVSLSDRLILTAIVNALAPRIETFLLGSDIVYWPRAVAVDKRWAEFERSVLGSDPSYVVRGDVAGFYESIHHEHLIDAVIRATGMRSLADALAHFLLRLMGRARGLPQGLRESDAMATVYLASLDFRMVQSGFRYARHGDDIRVGVKSYDEGRRAVECVEKELRTLGLLLNSAKTRVLRRATYQKEMSSFHDVHNRTRTTILGAKVLRARAGY